MAIDDAGSGYAGLQWLMALSPDLIKLDRALIDRIDEDEVKTALVEMLGSFAGRVDAWVLAEGVERMAELDVILRLGVPLAQGYLFCRPTFDLWPMIRSHHSRPSPVPNERRDDRTHVGAADRDRGDAVPHGQRTEDTCIVVDERNQPVALDLPGCDAAEASSRCAPTRRYAPRSNAP